MLLAPVLLLAPGHKPAALQHARPPAEAADAAEDEAGSPRAYHGGPAVVNLAASAGQQMRLLPAPAVAAVAAAAASHMDLLQPHTASEAESVLQCHRLQLQGRCD